MSGTLKYHLDNATAVFGADSPAVAILKEKISEHGEDAEVNVDESQLIALLFSIHNQSRKVEEKS
jgi:hypothetical protein